VPGSPDEVRLLGGFSVALGGKVVDASHWNRRAGAGLVKVLALAAGRRAHREQVMDALWPDCAVAEAMPRLHKATHFARRALGSDGIGADGDCLILLPGRDVVVDVEVFESRAGRALDGTAGGDVDDALAWYGGELLPQDVYEDWSVERRSAVRHLHLQLLRRAGRWSELLKEDSTDESAHVELMRSHLARGDSAAAIAQYDELAAVLERELGVAPGREAAALRAAAQAGSAPLVVRPDARLASQEVRFCRATDGLNLAYAVSGDGPPLVKAANWLSHLEHDWESLVWRHWLHTLSGRCRLLRYDERGCGLSDWESEVFDVDAWVADLLTVVDAAGYDRFPLLGISQGAAVAIEFAAAHPERVSALILYGSYIAGPLSAAGDLDDRRTAALLPELAELGWASDEPSFRQVFTSRFMPDAPRSSGASSTSYSGERRRRRTPPASYVRSPRSTPPRPPPGCGVRHSSPTSATICCQASSRDERSPA
jgi:DNA-binding SARP family transcriptional activator/pimeloyl-ACP methyl ester carboxylesterase